MGVEKFVQAIPAIVTTVAILALIFVPLERLSPLRAKKHLRAGIFSDLGHLVVTSALTGIIVAGFTFLVGKVLDTVVVLPLASLVPGFSIEGFRAGVAHQPIWLQVVEMLVLADFFAYWLHRSAHELRPLWRFHCVHHSPAELDWLATPRLHPVDQALKNTAKFVPVYLCGFDPTAFGVGFGIIAAFLGYYVFLVHANVRVNLAWIEPLHITPRFHHWHHALDPINKNYADQFPVWDILFGSYHMPDGQKWPAAYGTHAPVPTNWFMQMVHPFNPWARFSWNMPQEETGEPAADTAPASAATSSRA
ncbi:MAG: sterol desaturase family protein [Alphaproteobacteria bacterium]|nr:sterol desaturase family protein [Alphaproteobacteria bacterium]